jgi:hypothetical protein
MSVVAPSVPYMKRVLKVRMLSTGPEAAALEATLLACNRAASWLSAAMYADRVHSKHDAQRRFYAELKRQFQLSAQPTIRVIGKWPTPTPRCVPTSSPAITDHPVVSVETRPLPSRLSSAVMRRSRLMRGVCRGRSPTRSVGARRQYQSGPPKVD